MMTNLLIEDIMNNDILLMAPEDTLSVAIKKMQEKNTDYVLIGSDGYLEGIVIERDVVAKVVSARLNPDTIRLKSIMNTPVTTIERKTHVKDAWELISDSKIKRLIVTEADRPIGVVTSFDILAVAPEVFMCTEAEETADKGGFCEFCGNYFPSLNMVEGKYVCDSCKDQLLED